MGKRFIAGIVLLATMGSASVPFYQRNWGAWEPVPKRLVGVTMETIDGDQHRVTKYCKWHVDDTTYIICPKGVVISS